MSNAFDVETFKNELRTSWIGSECLYIESLGSTNSFLKKIPGSELIHGTVLITDNQYQGRGQYDKYWESEPNKNLTFTIAFKPSAGERLTFLTLACANAICNIFSAYTDVGIEIKWPNDIIANNKKIGGILTECIFTGQCTERVLIGIGLNIYQTKFSSDVEGAATSLYSISGNVPSREVLLANILAEIEQVYMKWHKHDVSLQREINNKLIGYGQWVRINVNGELHPGQYKFIGVGENGELLLLNEELDLNTFKHEQVRIIPGNQSIQKAV